MSMLSCVDLWKVYGGKVPEEGSAAGGGMVALRGASFEVKAGECFVIMGLSGSGKSTLIRCLTRLVEPSQGMVCIEGQDLTKASSRALLAMRRKYMGMVFQHFALLPHLNVVDNIGFPLAVRGVEAQRRRARASELASTVGLTGRELYFPSQLSGGQQQRVGIARALASDPHVLFMDEPFSALDPLLRRELQTEFMRLRRNLNKTIVFITHDFDEAIRLADRIAIMKDGVILEIGTPEELIVHSVHPYVREFTQHADRKSVVRARTLARLVQGGVGPSITVPADSLVSEVAAEILMAKGPVGVTENGRLLGLITPADVLGILTDDAVDGRVSQ